MLKCTLFIHKYTSSCDVTVKMSDSVVLVVRVDSVYVF